MVLDNYYKTVCTNIKPLKTLELSNNFNMVVYIDNHVLISKRLSNFGHAHELINFQLFFLLQFNGFNSNIRDILPMVGIIQY